MKNKTKNEEEFDAFLDSIGGLVNGYYTDRIITSSDFCECGDGWLPLIKELIEKSISAGWDKQICQIKSKFGGLRFYINYANEDVYQIISEYELKSLSVCEECGAPGKLTRSKSGWLTALCDEHMKETDTVVEWSHK